MLLAACAAVVLLLTMAGPAAGEPPATGSADTPLPVTVQINGVAVPVNYILSRSAGASALAAYKVNCLPGWRYIKSAVAGGLYPDDSGSRYMFADGNRAVDPWNQQFLACWIGEPGARRTEWAFYANRGKGWVHGDETWNWRVFGTGPNPYDWYDTHWYVCSLDGHFVKVSYYPTSKFMSVHTGAFGSKTVWADRATAGGGELFSFDPPLENIPRC